MDTTTILSCLPRLATYSEIKVPLVGDAEHKVRYVYPVLPIEEGEFLVHDHRMVDAMAKFNKLVKRAEKLGVPVPTLATVRIEDVPVIECLGSRWHRTAQMARLHVLRPSVEPVKLPGFTFAGTIQHLGEDGNILRAVPSFEGSLPIAYRTDKPTCEHCNLSRNRNDTFIMLRSSDRTFVRVGRNCLTDFIGEASAQQIIEAATFERSFAACFEDSDDYSYGGSSTPERASTIDYCAATALVIAKEGWLSRGAAKQCDKVATASLAWEILFPPKRVKDKLTPLTFEDITDAHFEEAKAALAWAREIDPETPSDYLSNIRVVSNLGSWSHRESGLGASIVSAYQREQGKLKRMEFEKKLPSVYVGEVGTRFGAGKGTKAVAPLTARVLGIYKRDGDYGLTSIIRLQVLVDSATVADAVWFASGIVDVVVDQGVLDAHVAAAKASEKAWSALHASDHDSELYDAAKAADALRNETSYKAEKAKREVAEGDVVLVVGTVKKIQVSAKTQRKETVLSRCSLKLVQEEGGAK